MEKKQIKQKLLDMKLSLFSKQIIGKEIKYYQEKSLKDNKYYSMAYSGCNKINYELFKEWDEKGSIPLDFGLRLKEIMNDKNMNLYIHRTSIINNENIFDSNVLMDVMENGLINNGSAHSNATSKETVPPISKTADLIKYDIQMQIDLKSHRRDSFGNISTGAIIFAIPSKYLNENDEVIVDPNLVYDYKNNLAHIKPEFIIGATTLKNHGECEFYSREDLLKNKRSR
ncbi:MAG: hypothetical protein E7158_01075 [Firmicutes bacterium]|nr:hypothetical protein [Bacillota bacterium]